MRDFSEQKIIRDLSSDLKLNSPYTFSFWVQIDSDNAYKQLLSFTHSENLTHKFLYTEDQQVVVDLSYDIKDLVCKSDKLSNMNSRYYHHNSIQVITFSLWLLLLMTFLLIISITH